MNPITIVRKIPFKFRNYWILESDYEDTVAGAWNADCLRTAQFRLIEKLKKVKNSLKDWQRGKVKNLELAVDVCVQKLKDGPDDLQSDFFNEDKHKAWRQKMSLI